MDSKLQEILLDYGLEGYGLYWYCLEMIVNKIDVDNLTFELEHDARIIARNTGSTTKKISEMMLRFVELDLFQNSEGRVTCLKLLQRLDKSMTSNVKFRNMLTKAKESHDSVMIEPDLVMQDKITLQEITQDKKTLKESNKSSNDDDIKFLTAITNHWNEIMTTQPRINLLDKTKATKSRIVAIKKISKDYPNYLDDEYFQGYFYRLATMEEFDWQRKNKQVTFDQATNLTKFARNIEMMRMEESA